MCSQVNSVPEQGCRHYYWIHAEKRRYYAVRIVQDLWGEWVLLKSWGSLSTKRGGQQSLHCGSLAVAEEKVAAIARSRRYRHYQQASVNHTL